MTQMLRPSMSSSAAALAAGRLTESMWLAFLSWAPRPRRQFMLGPEESEQWRLLADVEDILRTLGQAPRPLGGLDMSAEAVPSHLRNAALAWHARQSARLHRSEALRRATEEVAVELSSRSPRRSRGFGAETSSRSCFGAVKTQANAIIEDVREARGACFLQA